MSRYALTLALVLSLVSPGAVTAASEQRAFSEDVAVTLVEVPVQVIRGGEPVRGLTAEDFVLFDRGVRQELVGFEVIDALTVRQETGVVETARERLPVPVAAPPAGRHVLMLFDFQFASRLRIERAVGGARDMLDGALGPGDRVAVAAYAGRTGANLLVGFTRDRKEIELGLSYVEAIARGRRQDLIAARESLIEYWLGPAESSRAADDEGRFRSLARRLGASAAVALAGRQLAGETMGLADYDLISGAGSDRGADGNGPLSGLVGPQLIDEGSPGFEDLLSQVLSFSESLADLVTLLRDVPQPKHLLYYSEGFPTWILTNPAAQGRAIERIRRGIRATVDSGWVIQAIDVEGVPDTFAASGRSAETFDDPGSRSFVTGSARGELVPATGGSGFDAEALAYLAGETGGFVAENFNNLALAGERILQATAVTYLLVFAPRDLEADGALHRLEVELVSPRRRARVLHRTAYRAPAPPDERGETARRMDQARLVTGNVPVAELAAESLLLPGPRTRFVVELAPSALDLSPASGVVEIDFQAYLFTAGGQLVDLLGRRLALDLETVGDRLRRGGLRLAAGFEPPPGRHRVRLIVSEAKTGRVFARTHELEVAADRERWALPPVFFDPVGETLFLEVEPAGWDELGLAPNRHAPAAGARVASGGRRALVFVFRLPAAPSPTLTVRLLTAAGGAADGGSVEWKERLPSPGDGSTRLLGELDAGRLAPGNYRLELSVDDGASGEAVVAAGPFTVDP